MSDLVLYQEQSHVAVSGTINAQWVAFSVYLLEKKTIVLMNIHWLVCNYTTKQKKKKEQKNVKKTMQSASG